MLVLHASLLGLGLLSGLALAGMEHNLKLPNLIVQLLFTAYIVLLFAVSILVPFMLAMRYYNSLFTDEGYLTNTLPLTSAQKVLPRLLVGFACMIMNIFSVMLSLFFLFLPFLPETIHRMTELPELFKGISALFTEAFELLTKTFQFPNLAVTVIFLIITGLICLAGMLLQIYFSISVGSIFSSHRILFAVLVYFGTSMALNVLSSGGLYVFGSLMNTFPSMPVSVMVLAFPVAIALLSAAAFWVCCLVLDKKLNI